MVMRHRRSRAAEPAAGPGRIARRPAGASAGVSDDEREGDQDQDHHGTDDGRHLAPSAAAHSGQGNAGDGVAVGAVMVVVPADSAVVVTPAEAAVMASGESAAM
jgi:hypothetical protein